LFSDLPLHQASTATKAGFQKIKYTCDQALDDELEYAWVDTCCIDKTSSTELSEAINSMFNWYSDSATCYAFLGDVSANEIERDLPKSRWFTRGWTLQELIAPAKVYFYDRSWKQFGDRQILAQKIAHVTRIDLDVLRHGLVGRRHWSDQAVSLNSLCIARKMSWASNRVTSRQEDIAYCLLGIFDINMPLLYGERDCAFERLQEEIIRRSDSDDSILAWGLSSEATVFSPQDMSNLAIAPATQELLARSPKAFENCRDLVLPHSSDVSFSLTNTGINLRIPTISIELPEGGSNHGYCLVGLLGCSSGIVMRSHMLGIILHPLHGDDGQHTTRSVFRGTTGHLSTVSRSNYSTTIFVSTRNAIRRTESNVTIVRKNRQSGWFNESYVINFSEDFCKNLEWYIVDVTGWSQMPEFHLPRYRNRDPKDWDPSTMAYTHFAGDDPLDMLSLEFSIWFGPSPSSYTLDIEVGSRNDHPEVRSEAAFESTDGRRVKITVTWVDESTIHRWRIFSVNIGIVQVLLDSPDIAIQDDKREASTRRGSI